MNRHRFLEWSVVLVAFAAAVAYGLTRIRFGINVGDEGLYLASPLRYALGDVPLRDEFLNVDRMFDLVLTPLFLLAPDISVFQVRLVWLLAQCVSMVGIFLLFRRFAPPAAVAIAAAATIWLPVIIWTPGYHLMGLHFFVLGWTLWLSGCLAQRLGAQLALGATGGLVYFLGAVSYIPLLAAGIVPTVVLLGEWRRGERRSATATATVALFGGLAAATLALLLAFARFGLVGAWLEAHRDMSLVGRYAVSWLSMAGTFVLHAALELPTALLAAALVALMVLATRFGARRSKRLRMLSLLLAAAFAVGLVVMLLRPVGEPVRVLYFGRAQRVTYLVLGLHLGALAFARGWTQRPDDRSWRLVYWSMTGGALVFGVCHGVFSTQVFKIMFAVLPLAVAGMAAVARQLSVEVKLPAQRRQAFMFLTLLCLTLVAASAVARHNHNYVNRQIAGGPAGIDRLTRVFAHPRLAGIRSYPDQVRSLEGVLWYLSTRIEPGDFLLAYEGVPLINYLTATRPALDHSFTYFMIPPELRRRSVGRMVERGRVPRYAVRCTTPGRGENPVDEFVVDNYVRVATFPPQFEVWELDEPAGDRPRTDAALSSPGHQANGGPRR
jgi:hypothetical protein